MRGPAYALAARHCVLKRCSGKSVAKLFRCLAHRKLCETDGSAVAPAAGPRQADRADGFSATVQDTRKAMGGNDAQRTQRENTMRNEPDPTQTPLAHCRQMGDVF